MNIWPTSTHPPAHEVHYGKRSLDDVADALPDRDVLNIAGLRAATNLRVVVGDDLVDLLLTIAIRRPLVCAAVAGLTALCSYGDRPVHADHAVFLIVERKLSSLPYGPATPFAFADLHIRQAHGRSDAVADLEAPMADPVIPRLQ